MLRKFWNFICDDDGQTSTEYILLVAVVALIVFRFKDVATEKLNAITGKVFGKAGDFVDNM